MNEEKDDDYFVKLHTLMLATNKQEIMSNPNPTTPPPSQIEEVKIIYRTRHLFDYMCLHVSTDAEEANTKESFIRATVGQQNLHHDTQQVAPKELEEL